MKLRHIEVFHAVYVTGSVSGGARALNVSQPTVSKVLKHAEDQLGFLLFERISGRLLPTEKGRQLFVEIEPLFEQLIELDRYTTMLSNTRTGRLRVAMTPAFGLEIAPAAIAAFSKSNPDITIEVETLHSHEVVRALTDNVIDLGLVFDAPSFPGVSSQNLGTTEFVCVTPKGMMGQSKTTISLEELEGYTLINLNQKSVLGQILSRKLDAAFHKPADSRIIVETYHVAKRLVKHGAGIAIIDAITAFSGDTTGLEFLKIDPAIRVNVDLITRINEPGSRFRHDFITDIQAVMRDFQSKTAYQVLAKK